MVGSLDDYDVEEEEEEEEEGVKGNNATRRVHEDASRHPNEAILEAAANRVVEANKASASGRQPRPRPPKFGANTLLGPKGFKLLRQRAATQLNLTDDPIRDLDQLMRLYGEWVHDMYPKFQFRDTIDKIERHCRTASMKAYLTALWRTSEGGGHPSENPEQAADFDELQYVADRDAQDAANVLRDIGQAELENSPVDARMDDGHWD